MSSIGWRQLAAVLVLFVSACGGGGSPPAPPAVTSVVIEPGGLLLARTGDSRQLVARVRDAQGQAVDAPVTWTSSRPAQIAVSASGTATAQVGSGAAQIVAQAGGVSSAPMLAVVTPVASGAVLLTDAQIDGEPIESVSGAAPSFDNTFTVTLTGLSAPTVGTLLINTESKPVAGRVRAVDTSGGRLTVTLGLVSLREMLPNLELNETLDLAKAEVVVPDAIAAAYEVRRTGSRFEFVPKSGTAASREQAARGRERPLASGPALGPFGSCETSFSGPLPLALKATPKFSVDIHPSLDVVHTSANGLERLVAKAEPTVTVEATVDVTAAFEGSVDCSTELFAIRVPLGPPPLALVAGGVIPVGVGVAASGKLTLATASLGAAAQVKAKAEIGVACPGGADCAFVRSLGDFSTSLTPIVDAPSLGDLRLEPTLQAYGFVAAQFGNPFIRSLRFEAFRTQAGAQFDGSFALKASQLADPAYQSDYKVSLQARAAVGADLGSALKLFGLGAISEAALTVSTELGRSPLAATVQADRAAFNAGDTVNVTVDLDPASVQFIAGVGPYNVARVQLVRSVGNTVTTVASAEAASGQTHFELPVAALDSGTAQQFTAFVVTTLLPADVLALELRSAVAPSRVLNIVAGGGQTAPPGQLLTDPIAVQVANTSDGSPAAGVDVTFFVASGGGTVGAATAVTDALGRASTTWTLGTTPGTQTLQVKAVGAAEVAVSAKAGLVITTSSLPQAASGRAYSTTIAAAGSGGAVGWALVAGALPAGLSLDAATGTIAGTPGASGSFELSVQASDGVSSGTKAFTLLVDVNVPLVAGTYAGTGRIDLRCLLSPARQIEIDVTQQGAAVRLEGFGIRSDGSRSEFLIGELIATIDANGSFRFADPTGVGAFGRFSGGALDGFVNLAVDKALCSPENFERDIREFHVVRKH